MFGIFRLYLALAVVAYHLLQIPAIGECAVFSFFTLSGYLMTMIMARTYGYTRAGMLAYAGNRALRLYPAYWTAIAISIAAIAVTGGGFATAINPVLDLPHTSSAWLANGTMIFPAWMPKDFAPRLSPATWALTVELFYYALIGLGATATLRRTLALLVAGLGYHAWHIAAGSPFQYHYSMIFAGALPFAAGALAYHARAALSAGLTRIPSEVWLVLHAATLAGATMLVLAVHAKSAHLIGHAAAIIVSVGTVIALHHRPLRVIGKGMDSLLGKFSYPVYLLHWQAGLLCAYFIFGRPVVGMGGAGLTNFAVALVLLALLSLVIVFAVDPAVERLRERIKRRAQAAGGADRSATPASASA